jgi:putative acetyltransferase
MGYLKSAEWSMETTYQQFLIRNWQKGDRLSAAVVIEKVLKEFGLPWQPEEADRDVINVEECYFQTGGEFWVVEYEEQIVGTAGYYPIKRGFKAVEVRKMYLLPSFRGRGLGKYLLTLLEINIRQKGYQEIWIETATILKQAVKLYQNYGYQSATGVETKRCDLVYVKNLDK